LKIPKEKLMMNFKKKIFFKSTLGKLSCVQTPSLRRRSRISQANIEGFSALISAIFATTSNRIIYLL
jgi:hypothetical protein